MNSIANIYINTNTLNNTNQKVYYSGKPAKIKDKIESIFEYTNIVYDKKVIITTKEETITKIIIAKDANSLITNMHEIIPIETIVNIKVVE